MESTVGQRIKARRKALGWSLERLAHEMCKAAGMPAGSLTNKDVYRSETGRVIPRDWLPALACALDIPVSELTQPTTTASSVDAVRAPLLTLHQAADTELPWMIRELNRHLIALDNELHGLPIARKAARAFKTVYRRLGRGVGDVHEREIQSAAAELAEITGWACFNEGRPRASQRFSQEALFLAQLSGDRGIELLTLQNLALLAGWMRRPQEELSIVRSVLEGSGLDPRVEAMFRCREGHVLGRNGDSARSAQAFARARGLLQEGSPSESPPWSWWVSAREVDRQEGRVLNLTRRWNESLPVLQRASDEGTGSHVGYGLVSQVWFVDSSLSLGAWTEAEAATHTLLPAVTEISSQVARGHLARVASRDIANAPAGLRDALEYIRKGLKEDPFEF